MWWVILAIVVVVESWRAAEAWRLRRFGEQIADAVEASVLSEYEQWLREMRGND